MVAGAEALEVGRSLWAVISEQSDDNPSGHLISDLDIKKDLAVIDRMEEVSKFKS
jgi:hypothetical protein